MADQGANSNAVGCLGRALTSIGVIWIVIVALAGIGVLSESGWSGDLLVGLGPSLIPGLILLAVGRTVSRRARSRAEDGTLPQAATRPEQPAQRAPIPFEVPPPVPPPPRSPPPPRPPVEKAREAAPESRADIARRLEETFAPLDQSGKPPQSEPEKSRPKTSQELIDEARRRWGMDKDH